MLELAAGDADRGRSVGALLRARRAAAPSRSWSRRSASAACAASRGVRRAGRRATRIPPARPGSRRCCKTIWGAEYDDERDARFINDRVHANIQKDRTFSVVPRIYGGVTSAAELRRIADVAERYQRADGEDHGRPAHRSARHPKEKLPDVWRDLGMPSGHAYTKAFRTCKTCVGTEFCRYGVGDSTALGIAIEGRFQGIESPAKLKLATAGCPRNCSEATTKDIGAVAIEGGTLGDLRRRRRGRARAQGRHARASWTRTTRCCCTSAASCSTTASTRSTSSAPTTSSSGSASRRCGDPGGRREGICARLDAAMQAAVDAYVDPWLEAASRCIPRSSRTRRSASSRSARCQGAPRGGRPNDGERSTICGRGARALRPGTRRPDPSR